MNESIIRSILLKDLNFSSADIIKLEKFKKILLQYNDKYNFIGKSTIPLIWHRHFLDSAQLVKYIAFQAKDLSVISGQVQDSLALF